MKTIPVVKVKQSLCRINAQTGSHVFIVGQRGTEADQTHVLLSQLHVADGPRHQGLQNGSTVIVQQVDFILDDAHLVILKTLLYMLSNLPCGATYNDNEAH